MTTKLEDEMAQALKIIAEYDDGSPFTAMSSTCGVLRKYAAEGLALYDAAKRFETPIAPPRWEVGMIVAYRRDNPGAWCKGAFAFVSGLYKDHNAMIAGDKYQIFYTSPLNQIGKPEPHPFYWTAPNDVDLVADSVSDITVNYQRRPK